MTLKFLLVLFVLAAAGLGLAFANEPTNNEGAKESCCDPATCCPDDSCCEDTTDCCTAVVDCCQPGCCQDQDAESAKRVDPSQD